MQEPLIESLSERPNTIVQLWKNYRQCSETVQQLIQFSEQKPHVHLELPASDQVHILLVDDSKSARRIYQQQLESLKAKVITAIDAEDAWEKLHKYPFDIAIIDYFMPGANGAMLCQRMTESERFTHIIKAVLTGTYKEALIEECIGAGARECMFKDESMQLIKARVSAMVQQVLSNRKMDEQRNHLASILTSVGEGIYGVDDSGLISFINPAGLSILDYSTEDELVGKPAHKLFHHSDEFGRAIPDETNYLYQAYLLKDSLKDWETVFWTSSGQPIHVECTIHPLTRGNKMSGSVVVFKNISERKLLEDELNWQLNHDHLTQLLNKTYFERLLQQELRNIHLSHQQSALLYIDLDNFKMVNDEAGHSAGDQLLITIGEQIRSRLRHRDVAARLSGDEFAVLLHDINVHTLPQLAEAFKKVLENIEFTFNGQQFPVSGSIGVVTISDQKNDHKQLLAEADMACKLAKQKGKNQVYIFSGQDHYQSGTFKLPNNGWRSRIDQGLEQGLFSLNYQPIYQLKQLDLDRLKSIDSSSIRDEIAQHHKPNELEAFLRLEQESGKPILPRAFLSDAERFDLISKIDLWVVRQVISQIKEHQLKIPVNINLSAHTLLDTLVLEQLREALQYHPDQTCLIRIELKEHHLLHYREQLIPVMEQLSDLGCSFQVDDFGRNFSLFSRIRELPIQGIKIDGVFTQNVAWDPVDKQLMHSMAEVARTAGISTTVKSIESLDALTCIEQGGIDLVQGYLLGKPVKAEQL
jgi:diguanylate cyclase (GGDEF)-like protein/PAS domain S-box-containing protein